MYRFALLAATLVVLLAVFFSAPLLEAHTPSSSRSPALANATDNAMLVDHLGGDARAVAVEGEHLYAGLGRTLALFDLSEPDVPVPVSRLLFPSPVTSFDVEGTVVAVLAGSMLYLVDVSDTVNPVQSGSLRLPSNGGKVRLVGDVAYATLYHPDPGLAIFDVSDPSAPERVEWSGSEEVIVRDLAVSGDTLFTVAGERLKVYDIADPLAPRFLAYYPTSNGPGNFLVAGSHVFVQKAYPVEPRYGIEVIDVTQRDAPEHAGELRFDEVVTPLAANGGLLLLQSPGILRSIDISEPAEPEVWGTTTTTLPSNEAIIYESNAYLARGEAGIARLDISDSTLPTPPTTVYGVAPSSPNDGVDFNGFLYVASSQQLTVLDTSNPAAPVIVGQYPDLGGQALNVFDQFLLAGQGDVMTVIDISNPAQLAARATLQLPADFFVMDIVIDGDYAYLIGYGTCDNRNHCWGGGLQIVDISDPSEPRLRGRYMQRGSEAVLSGGYVYFVSYGDGIHILDITDPDNPSLAYRWSIIGDIRIVDEVAYIASSIRLVAELFLFDISSPTSPQLLSSLVVPYSRFASGNLNVEPPYAYLGSLAKIDVSDPNAPFVAGLYDNGFPSLTMPVGEYVYSFGVGLRIIRFAEPGRVAVEPELSTTLRYSDTEGFVTTVELPAGAVTEPVTLTLHPLVEESAGDWRYSGHAILLEVEEDDGPQPGFTFTKPVTLTTTYSAQALGSIRDESALRWLLTGAGWRDAAESCDPPATYSHDPQNNQLQLSICTTGRLGLYSPMEYLRFPLLLR